MSEIVKINPSEYGLTDQTAQNIASQFQPMLDKMVAMEKEFNEVLTLPIDSPQTSKVAKELRLRYVKLRTATAEIHKEQKAFYLNGGRFVDGWKNAQIFASQGKEETLEKIEKHLENLEKERIAKINAERVELVRLYVLDVNSLNVALWQMEDDVWAAFLSAKKADYEDRIAAEQAAEQARIAQEKAQAEASELQRLENIRLKAEAEAREKEIEAERKANKERLSKEIEAKAKVEAELKAKQAAEMKAEQERKEAEIKAQKEAEKLAKAPIKEQLNVWVDSFSIPETSIENEKTLLILQKFEAFKKWAKSEIESM